MRKNKNLLRVEKIIRLINDENLTDISTIANITLNVGSAKAIVVISDVTGKKVCIEVERESFEKRFKVGWC